MRSGLGMCLHLVAFLFWVALSTSSCGGSYEETVGGVKIPIPNGMTKSQDQESSCRYRASERLKPSIRAT